jgi:hypothetical protein
MAIERNNPALEFETMLRRHLKSGGAPVAACTGFDFDAASAYLEDALGRTAGARFETHLAGCAACRRHLIELARLSQVAPHAETQPVAVADQTPVRVRWREAVAGWLDLSAWRWKWQTVGAAGAAFAILIAALSFQLWRQTPGDASKQAAVRSSAGAMSPAANASPLPEPSLQISDNANYAALSARPQSRADARVPKPEVGPKPNERELAVVPSRESLRLPADQSQFNFSASTRFAPFETQPLRTALAQGFVPSPPSLVIGGAERAEPQIAVRLAGQPQAAMSEAAEAADGSRRRDVIAQITPPPEYNPMIADSEKPPPPSGKAQNEKAESQQVKSDWRKRVMGFLPERKPEPERKPSIRNEDDESVKPLTVRIRDKVFRFDRNMWIDQAYKPEIMKWRVLKLTRGSKEYEQVLVNDPQLKEFFDHGPILVVWGNKIYKVGQ